MVLEHEFVIETLNNIKGFHDTNGRFHPLMAGGSDEGGAAAGGDAGGATSGDGGVATLDSAMGDAASEGEDEYTWEDSTEEDESEQEAEEEPTEADNFFAHFRSTQPRQATPVEQHAQQIQEAVQWQLSNWESRYAQAKAAVEAEVQYLPEDQAMVRLMQLEDARLRIINAGMQLRERAREAAQEPIVRSQAIDALTNIVMKSVPKGSISKAEIKAALEDTHSAEATMALAQSLTTMARRGANVQRASKGTDRMGGAGPVNTNRPNLKTFDVLSSLDKAYAQTSRDLARGKRR